MAMQSVPPTNPAPHCLPLDQVDRASDLIQEVNAIVDLMACASLSEKQPLEDSIPMAAFAVRSMLMELAGITTLRVIDEKER